MAEEMCRGWKPVCMHITELVLFGVSLALTIPPPLSDAQLETHTLSRQVPAIVVFAILQLLRWRTRRAPLWVCTLLLILFAGYSVMLFLVLDLGY